MNNSNFNIVQLALVAVLVVVSTSLITACGLADARTTARKMQASTQLRGIHQGLVTYGNSNRNWFPGINAAGENDGIEVQSRYQVLLEGDFFTPEYPVSPLETDANITYWVSGNTVTDANYSFAMLQVPDKDPSLKDNEQGRRSEWAQSLNSQAIVMSDRNTGSTGSPTSIHNGSSWEGAVLWNDNAVMFELTDTFFTKYDGGQENPQDPLFDTDSNFDAMLIHAGN